MEGRFGLPLDKHQSPRDVLPCIAMPRIDVAPRIHIALRVKVALRIVVPPCISHFKDGFEGGPFDHHLVEHSRIDHPYNCNVGCPLQKWCTIGYGRY